MRYPSANSPAPALPRSTAPCSQATPIASSSMSRATCAVADPEDTFLVRPRAWWMACTSAGTSRRAARQPEYTNPPGKSFRNRMSVASRETLVTSRSPPPNVVATRESRLSAPQ